MGFRNPFRMSVDKATGVVYVGDYGPDAGTTERQPRPERAGRVRPDHRRRATTAGRTAPAPTPPPRPTTSGTSPPTPPAPKYNCAGGPTNNSFRNTGQGTLPAGPAGLDPVRRRRRHARRSSAAAPSRRWAARSTATTRPTRRRRSSRQAFDGHFFAGEFGRALDQADPRQRATARRGAIDDLPVDRHAGHGHGVRPGRRALRPRLRHRLLQRRRQLGAVPLRLRRPAATGRRPRSPAPTRPPGRRR